MSRNPNPTPTPNPTPNPNLTRYLDLFWNWLSYYNVVMKIIFIISSIAIVYTPP